MRRARWRLYWPAVIAGTALLVWLFWPLDRIWPAMGGDPTAIANKFLFDTARGRGWWLLAAPAFLALARGRDSYTSPALKLLAAAGGLGIGAHWLIAGLHHITNHPYDWYVYWQAGQGNLVWSMHEGFWVYNPKVAIIFRWALGMDYLQSWAYFYIAIAAATGVLVYRLVLARWLYAVGPAIALIVAVNIESYLRCGNIQPALLLIAAHPIGAVAATCIKPYFAAFIFLHAGLYWQKNRGAE